MPNVTTNIYDKTIDRAAMIRLYAQAVAKKLTTIIDGHEVRLWDVINASKAKMTPELRESIDKELKHTYAELYNSSSRSLTDLAVGQVDYTYANLSNAISKIWETQRPARRIAEEIALERPLYKDMTLAAGWAGMSLTEKKNLENVLRRGIAQGMNETQLTRFVMNSSVTKIVRTQALGLSRTAITSVYAQADHEVYKANEKALRGYQYIAVLDSRTTPICAHRDGQIYPIGDISHLPPAHWHCRSTTIPVVKSYDDFLNMEGVAQIRKRNLAGLNQKQIDYYDGLTPEKETYNDWLMRQPEAVQLKHLGDTTKLDLFRSGKLSVEKFQENGRSLSISELRQMTDGGVAGDTHKFALAKERLDTLKLGASRPEDFMDSPELRKALKEYYLLQSGDLNGNLSYTNYRGTLLHTKKAARQRVLSTPPTEDNLKFNPITNRYEDARLFQPNPKVLANNLRLVNESDKLKDIDKTFINDFLGSLETSMSVNERAVIAENLRITFSRYRTNLEPWHNMKAVLNSQIKFDVMNVSDYIETQLRRDSDLFAKLAQYDYIDAVLGPQSIQNLHDTFIDNIFEMRKWEASTAPKVARKLRNVLDRKIPLKITSRLEEADFKDFYLKFAKRLAVADTPDRDQLAVALGRDLYNAANFRGSRNEWFNLGTKLLDDAKDKGFYELETFGVQKRRMKSRNGNRYFGPYYDTFSVNLRVVDPDILKYTKLSRKVDVGLRIGVTTEKNRLHIKEGYKTYFDVKNRDTGIPITSVDSFMDFPSEMIDKDMATALNWAAKSEFKVDPEFHDFIEKLLHFQDDKGKAEHYNMLNEYRKYIVERGDSYERFKNMKWLRDKDAAFSNHPFLDHRGRIYERGFIGPQSGETFRPFLNTSVAKNFSEDEFFNLQDQVGSFIGGLSDKLEGNFNSLAQVGRQKIAERWRPEMVKIGNHILRAKPGDIKAVLDSPLLAEIDGEDQGKVLRLALELAKIDNYLGGNYSNSNLVNLRNYKISVALEQDASSSGAQIIALTTKNKQLAELSNVVPTTQKRRLYDEIAASTYADPRFRKLNEKLGLSEKDLRKAAKAQNMVTFKYQNELHSKRGL